MMAGEIISGEALVYGYGRGQFTLAIDSLSVDPGETIAVAGPSGCGKSTFLELIAGERVPTSGALTVLGQKMPSLSPRARRRLRLTQMGIVFQDHPLIAHLSALENVLLPYHLGAGGPGRGGPGARERAVALLEALGIADGSKTPGTLSQGERQRVAIARALVTEPPLILADEPTSGLDRRRAEAITVLLLSLCQQSGTALLFVTHDDTLLPRFDRVLDGGRFAQDAKGGGRG